MLSAQTVLFISQNEIAAGLSPVSLAIGGFQSDREADLAVVDSGSASIPILMGLGGGFFQPLASVGAGVGPRAIAVGDFNRDLKLDLVIANFGSQTVSVVLGNGNGTFRPDVDFRASGPSAIVVGDFNDDGRLDFAVTNRNSNNVSIFRGNGDGTFLPALNFDVGVGPVSIATGDFNGDQQADLVVVNQISSSVSLLLGNGDGTFQTARTFFAGQAPVSVAVGDFNHDGKTDLAVANALNAGTVSVLFGNGNGSFRIPLTFPAGPNPAFIISRDFNLDGDLDLAVANAGSNTISILENSGDGVFFPPFEFIAGDGPVWLGVSDFNADGKPDLAVVNGVSNTISVLINRTFVPDQPAIASHGVLNSASYQTSFLAPGELVTIFGSNLGPAKLTGLQLTGGRVSTSLAQTRVLFDGIPAPLLYVQADQIGAMVPYAVGGRLDTQVIVENKGRLSPTITIPVADSAPGLFTVNARGTGQGAILNQDLTLNSASNPAARGSIVVLFGTGAGQTSPPTVDGELAGRVPPKPALPVSVTIDGRKAQVLYAGAIPGALTGLLQVNVRLPDGVRSGNVPVLLYAGEAASQARVTLAVQ
jgi:uncharacterized protein (TIGR03437 family)